MLGDVELALSGASDSIGVPGMRLTFANQGSESPKPSVESLSKLHCRSWNDSFLNASGAGRIP